MKDLRYYTHFAESLPVSCDRRRGRAPEPRQRQSPGLRRQVRGVADRGAGEAQRRRDRLRDEASRPRRHALPRPAPGRRRARARRRRDGLHARQAARSVGRRGRRARRQSRPGDRARPGGARERHVGRRGRHQRLCAARGARVGRAARAARRHRYLFVSSISVFTDASRPGTRREPTRSARSTIPRPRRSASTTVRSRRRASAWSREVFGARALNVRPGLIVGPHDPTDRFGYWVARFVHPQLAGRARAGGGRAAAAVAAGPVHRRARSRRVHARAPRQGPRRDAQRDEPRRAVDDGRRSSTRCAAVARRAGAAPRVDRRGDRCSSTRSTPWTGLAAVDSAVVRRRGGLHADRLHEGAARGACARGRSRRRSRDTAAWLARARQRGRVEGRARRADVRAARSSPGCRSADAPPKPPRYLEFALPHGAGARARRSCRTSATRSRSRTSATSWATTRSRSPITRPSRSSAPRSSRAYPDHGIRGEEHGREARHVDADVGDRSDRRHQELHPRPAALGRPHRAARRHGVGGRRRAPAVRRRVVPGRRGRSRRSGGAATRRARLRTRACPSASRTRSSSTTDPRQFVTAAEKRGARRGLERRAPAALRRRLLLLHPARDGTRRRRHRKRPRSPTTCRR